MIPNPLDNRVILLGRLGAVIERPSHRCIRIGDAKGHGAGRGSMFPPKGRNPSRVVTVQHQVDTPLFVACDVLHRMAVRRHETQLLELLRHRVWLWRGKLDKFKAVEPERIGSHSSHTPSFNLG